MSMYSHPDHHQSLVEIFGEPVSVYTRKQAIDDGVLVDVSETAKEMGFSVPVCLTSAVWDDCVEWSDKDNKRQAYQDESGRLKDVLFMALVAAKRGRGNTRVSFQVYRIPRGGRGTTPRIANLWMQIDGGDDGEPVITIMQIGED